MVYRSTVKLKKEGIILHNADSWQHTVPPIPSEYNLTSHTESVNKKSLNTGDTENTIYIKDGVKSDGTSVNFIDLILDGKKKGETRSHKNLTRKWVGIAKDGYVYGRVLLGDAYLIDKSSPEYTDSYIEGTNYDIEDGEKKYYYPILAIEDMRDNPRKIDKNGNYGKYTYSLKNTETVSESKIKEANAGIAADEIIAEGFSSLSGGSTSISRGAIRNIARRLIAQEASGYDLKSFTDNLESLFGYIEKNDANYNDLT